MSQVSILRCREYKKHLLKASIKEALNLIGGIDRFLHKGDRVLLKINLLSPKPPQTAVTTHPVFVEALVELFKETGAGQVMVGDSSGGAIAGKAVTGKAFKVSEVQEAAEKAGAEVLNFDKTGVEGIEVGNGETIYLAKPVVDADLVVSVPKLKTHSATLFTGAVKNMYGCIPGLRKAEYHRKYTKPHKFARVIADIYSVSRVGLAIMDGVTGMEGNGPGSGIPRDVGLVLASDDGVALDSVACRIIGYDPFKISHLVECHHRGLGVADLDKIQVKGLKIEDVEIKDYKLPSNAFLTYLPDFIASSILNALKAVPVADSARCTGCGVCSENCPPRVIRMQKALPVINYNECIECLCCHELCPQNAMDLQFKSPIGKILKKMLFHKRERR